MSETTVVDEQEEQSAIERNEEQPGVFEGLDQHPDPDADPAPEAPAPTNETVTVANNGLTDLVGLYDTTQPITAFPPNSQLVGERADDDLIGKVEAVGGLLQPIVVATQNGAPLEEVVGKPENLIDGRRRIQAVRVLHERAELALAQNPDLEEGIAKEDLKAEVARWATVPVRVVVNAEGADLNTTLLSVIAHSTRRDNDAVTYSAVHKLLAAGYDKAQIAKSTGIKSQTIDRIRRCDRLIEPMMVAFYEGKYVSGWVAGKASAFTAEEQQVLYDEYPAKGRRLTTDVLNDIRKKQRAGASDATMKEVIERVEEDEKRETEGGTAEGAADNETLRLAQVRIAELEGDLERIVAEATRREERDAQVTAELRAMVEERNTQIAALKQLLEAAEATAVSTDAGKSLVELEAAYNNVERLEKDVKLLRNEVARSKKQPLPFKDLGKERYEDEDAAF